MLKLTLLFLVDSKAIIKQITMSHTISKRPMLDFPTPPKQVQVFVGLHVENNDKLGCFPMLGCHLEILEPSFSMGRTSLQSAFFVLMWAVLLRVSIRASFGYPLICPKFTLIFSNKGVSLSHAILFSFSNFNMFTVKCPDLLYYVSPNLVCIKCFCHCIVCVRVSCTLT